MDRTVITAFLAGDAEAVFRLARWAGLEIRPFGSSGREREDLIQEALLRVWTCLRRGEYRGGSGLQRYVRSIARNVAIDHLRDSSRRPVTGEDPESTGEHSREPSAERHATARELADRVLSGLAEEDGRLLVEAYVLDRSYEEMADERGILRGTLKVRVFRAVRRAREIAFRSRPGAEASPDAAGAARDLPGGIPRGAA